MNNEIINLKGKTPYDMRGYLINRNDRLIIAQKDITDSGYTTSLTFARVIKVEYMKQIIMVTTPSSNGQLIAISFKKLYDSVFIHANNYFKNHTSDLKCHMGGLLKEKTIDRNDRIIYTNSKLQLSFGRVLKVLENGDIEVIGYEKKRSNIIPKDDIDRKVYLHTKNFFKNHKGDKCYDSHMVKNPE